MSDYGYPFTPDTSSHASTSNASLSPPDESEEVKPAVRRKDASDSRKTKAAKGGPPKQRNGKVIKLLRQKYTAGEGRAVVKANLAPTSTVAQLGSNSLAASLSYHLVQLSSGILTSPNTPPIVDISSVRLRLRTMNGASPAVQDILLASLQALGSRRSYHSSILGPAPVRFPATNSIGDIVAQDYGPKRENACRSLVQRAIDLAEGSNLLEDYSTAAQEVVAVLRVTVFAVSPRHPFASKLAEYLHETSKLKFFVDGKPPVDDLGLSIAEYDGYVATSLGIPPKISDAELKLCYGWHPGLIPEAMERLRAGSLTPGPNPKPPTADFQRLGQSFCRMWKWLDATQQSVAALHGHEEMRRALAPHLGAIPMVMEAHLTAQATRLCSGSSDFVARDIIEWVIATKVGKDAPTDKMVSTQACEAEVPTLANRVHRFDERC
ncbi:hypothetical protein P7C70_g5398, partial [Phenoliferia sp. Uapishka_3]